MCTQPNRSSLWGQLNDIIDSFQTERLADVFRFISFTPGESYGPHKHLRIEINHVKKGNCILRLEDRVVTFREGETMIITSNVDHYFEAGPKGTTLMQLEFLPEIFSNFDWNVEDVNSGFSSALLYPEANGIIKIVNNAPIVQVVQNILNELSGRKANYKYMVVMNYAELLILIHRYVSENYLPLCNNELLRKAVLYVQENIQKNVNVGDIARHLDISERYLRTLFSQHLNLSPVNYLNQIRINKAVELLRDTDLSIKEVGFKCGFQSPHYFSRVFKQYVGISPHEMKR